MGLQLLDGKLWVADLCKGRIVGFPLPITANRPEENVILGFQPPKERTKVPYWKWPQNNTGQDSSELLRIPWGLATDGKRFYVSDHALHRVAVFEAAGIGDPAAPARPVCVLGQLREDGAGFNGKSVFEGDVATPRAWSLLLPCAVSCDKQRLAVADSGNHRVLIWNTLPSKTGQPADLVLGQKDFTSAVRATSGASGMNRPRGVFTDGHRLFVADTMNHRVLIWNTFPRQNDQPADLVLGLPGFDIEGNWHATTDGRIGPDTMSYPHDVYSDGHALYVCDSGNNRILIWDTIPRASGQPCDRYLGMPGPGLGLIGGKVWRWRQGYNSGSYLDFPTSVRADDRAIYVSDTWHNRVLVFLR
jgi:hypothetical protein